MEQVALGEGQGRIQSSETLSLRLASFLDDELDELTESLLRAPS